MCPPVSTRHGAEGMSYLHAAWVYQLQHGQLRVCFACFKAAFLNLRQWLEWEDWEDEDWDPEPMDPTEAEAGSEQGASPGMWPSWGQGQGQPAGAGPVDWGLGTLASGPVESEEVGLSDPFVTTELEPQGATPLGLGAEDADWTQGLPWRFEVLSLVGCYDAVYLRKMKPEWALRTPEQRWQVLLEPEELWVVRLQDAPPKQELHQWHLSILESRPPGQDEELVHAESALLKRGFTIFSFSPWIKREAVEGDSASRPESSTQGCDPSTSGPSGPSGPGESLAFTGASALGELPRFPPFSPGPQN
ncbi:testis-expressed protein 19.2-like isoform X2 [Hippopotamus amphibius kiboko]|uniref:testis-expressed protein 19.2-like isoform X2 n=1 Tax=Hippopotamus amphibius kiboko TaxID=575201 RepID=UPI00259397AF|nr:testis-expressed protein 19.2-like isoform X2 [Hippopotamus amphibius kiboko]